MTAARSSSGPIRSASSTGSSGTVATLKRPQIITGSDYSDERRIFFRTIWLAVNVLLLTSLIGVVWSSAWEYSTRRYLKGFSDAIIPYSTSPIQKVEAILDWMSHTPARIGQAPPSLTDDRDPTNTLNYASLLRVCGTATNAFINLADSGGLTARRLLLLDANHNTVHVVAEVSIDDRWIVVDPTYHTIFRGPDGEALSSENLANPAVFASATRNIQGYDPTYSFDRAVHIRISRFGVAGRKLRSVLDRWWPDWEGSPILSLIVERESLGITVLLTLLTLVLLAVRVMLRWYGETRLGVRPQRMRNRLRRLGRLLLEPVE